MLSLKALLGERGDDPHQRHGNDEQQQEDRENQRTGPSCRAPATCSAWSCRSSMAPSWWVAASTTPAPKPTKGCPTSFGLCFMLRECRTCVARPAPTSSMMNAAAVRTIGF